MKLQLFFIGLFLCCLNFNFAFAQSEETKPIKEDIPELVSLLNKFAEAGQKKSNTMKRRAYKKVVRECKALVETLNESERRFEVLDLQFKTQQELFMINQTKEIFADVMETAKEIVKAPMHYAKIRLKPDVLLLQSDLSRNSKDKEASVEAIRAMAEKYFDTDAESESLMILIMMVKDLEEPGLFKELQVNLQTRFADDPQVTTFVAEHFGVYKRDLRFSGHFRTIRGKNISFPTDLVGHNYIICFWTSKTNGFEKNLVRVNDYLKLTNPSFKIFSFNLDELEDGGQSILKENACEDWIVMRLPKGVNNKAFLSYGEPSQFSVKISNATGYSLGRSTNRHTIHEPDVDLLAILNDGPYLKLMQAMSAGHFLLSEYQGPADDPLKAIQDCFKPIQHHYRLSEEAILNHYKKALQLCDEKLASKLKDKDRLRVQNYKLVALLGLWKSQFSDLDFFAAEKLAAEMLKNNKLSPEAKLIAEFCVAKSKMRQGATDVKSICDDFLKKCSDSKGKPSIKAYAAAVVLCMDGGRDLKDAFLTYRYQVLASRDKDPSLTPVKSYLLPSLNGILFFEANEKKYYFGTTSTFGNDIFSYLANRKANRNFLFPKVSYTFKTINGQQISIPNRSGQVYTLCSFVSLAKDEKEAKRLDASLQGIKKLISKAEKGRLECVLFFTSQDKAKINQLIKKNGLSFQAVILPDDFNTPIYRELGVYCTDRFLNTAMIAPNKDLVCNLSKPYHRAMYPRDKRVWFDCNDPNPFYEEARTVLNQYDKMMAEQSMLHAEWKAAAFHYVLTVRDNPKDYREIERLTKNAKAAAENDKHGFAAINSIIHFHARKNRHMKPEYLADYRMFETRARLHDKKGDKKAAEKDRLEAAKLKALLEEKFKK